MNRRTITALALLALGYLAGTLTAPHASALDGADRMLQEVTRIRQELAGIRQELGRRR